MNARRPDRHLAAAAALAALSPALYLIAAGAPPEVPAKVVPPRVGYELPVAAVPVR
jgi:hypothetical protein